MAPFSFILIGSFLTRFQVPRWAQAGKWLYDNTGVGDSTALVPIGAVGYYSDRCILDMVGLVNKHIGRRRVELGGGSPPHEKHDGAYVLATRATHLLLGNVQVTRLPLNLDDPEFVKPSIRAIRDREDDLFTDELWAHYEKRIADSAAVTTCSTSR